MSIGDVPRTPGPILPFVEFHFATAKLDFCRLAAVVAMGFNRRVSLQIAVASTIIRY